MHINNIGFYAWRHSLRRLNDFPFFRCKSMQEARELTRINLKNDLLAKWVEKLLNRDAGYCCAIIEKKETSDVSRQLDYLTRVLISTVIKNDIGLCGGVSPIFNFTHQAKYTSNMKVPVPAHVHFVNTDAPGFVAQSLAAFHGTRDDYVIPYSNNTNRLTITANIENQIINHTAHIARNAINENPLLLDCGLLAIDYFIQGDIATPLECHFPGRGIGIHLLPFILSKEVHEAAATVIYNIKEMLARYYGEPISLSALKTGNTAFHELDKIAVSLISDSAALTSKSIALDIDDSIHFNQRDSEINGQEDQVVISEEITDAETIKQQLGAWVVLKTRINTPWWSSSRKKPEILFVDNKLISRVNHVLNTSGDIILQRLVTNSVDTQGHFGELRAHYLVVR